ncbi:MAG: hypothetical protein R2839_03715 [Thermomicrobiales bacterium]
MIRVVALGVFGLDQLLQRKPVRHLFIVGVLSLAGVVINPFGFDYVEQILRFGGRPAIWNERISNGCLRTSRRATASDLRCRFP